MSGQAPTDQELVRVFTGLPDAETGLTSGSPSSSTPPIATAQRCLVDAFGLAPGQLTPRRIRQGSAGRGVRRRRRHLDASRGRGAPPRLPATLGAASSCMAVHVDDLDAHLTRVKAAGGEITQEPAAMPYGVRDYGARDSDGGLWSFIKPLDEEEQ